MNDKELLELNAKGFFPGPGETENELLDRVQKIRKKTESLGSEAIPLPHWDWVQAHLNELFDIRPECLPAFYSNDSLTPWQGAATWIEEGSLLSIQLRQSLKKGSYLGLYKREELLAHEAVHAARSPFKSDRWEEFFAYMASEKKWRRVLGPIAKRPWEVWPFLAFSLAGILFEEAFLGALLWVSFGLIRLLSGHLQLRRASLHLLTALPNPRTVRALLVRLTDDEINRFAKGENLIEYSEKQSCLRWKVICLAYFSKKGGV